MVTDQASLFPREAVGTLPVEELESISRVGKAARLVKTRIGIARTMPHRLCPLRGVLDAGNLIFHTIYTTHQRVYLHLILLDGTIQYFH